MKHRTLTRPPQPLSASLVDRAMARAKDKLERELVGNTIKAHEQIRRTWLRIANGEVEDDEGYQAKAETAMREARESLARMAEGADIRDEYARRTGQPRFD